MATYLPLDDFLVKRSPAVLKSNAKATVRSEDSALWTVLGLYWSELCSTICIDILLKKEDDYIKFK